MRPLALIALAGTLIGGMTAPSAAQELPPIEEYIPTFTRADLFLHRNTSAVGNIDAREGRFLTWNSTTPTGDQPAAYLSNNLNPITLGANHDPEVFLTTSGTALSDLNTIAFDLYAKQWAQSTIGCSMALSFQLVVDGVDVLNQDYEGSSGINYTVIDETTMRIRFAFTNLWQAVKELELPYGPNVQHQIYVNLQNFYLCNELVWLYDSATYPSGLIVNLDKPGSKGYTAIDVLDPPPPLGEGATTAALLAVWR
jgi:hypothetical protein